MEFNPTEWLTIPNYAPRHIKPDGTVGVHKTYIYELLREGKFPENRVLKISGITFIKITA